MKISVVVVKVVITAFHFEDRDMKIKVKCLNNFDNGTWKFTKDDEYYFDEYSGAVVGDNYIPVFCFADDDLIVAAISGDLTFQAVRD